MGDVKHETRILHCRRLGPARDFHQGRRGQAVFVFGKVRTVKEAVNKAGIAERVYKYKDLISPFYEMASGKILTFYMVLEDEPGILSGVLRMFRNRSEYPYDKPIHTG